MNRGQEEKATEDEMAGWHRQLNGHKSEQTLGDSEGQGSLAGSSPWGCKELDTTEPRNNSNQCRFNYQSVLIWKLKSKAVKELRQLCSHT